MYNKIEKELYKAYNYINDKKLFNWPKQNNTDDNKSNFIYFTNDFENVLSKIKIYNLDESYIINRWYNFHTSKTCESIFCNLGAVEEKNKYVDFYINGIPFDLKVTYYPQKLKYSNIHFNLSKINEKNKLIEWLYLNQSQEQRKHMYNKIFIVCNGKNNLKLKSEFTLIKSKIENWINNFISNPNSHNILKITDNGITYKVYSDIIEIND